MPRWSNFDIRRKCGTVSKVLWKSNTMTSVCLPWSMLNARSSTVCSSWDSQDRFWQNPCCTSVITSCFSQWLMICLNIQCSISLQQTEVKDTGRWFDGDERSPFLNKGVMKAVFQSVSKSPVLRLWVNNDWRKEAISSAHSWRIRIGILSRPEALFGFKLGRSFRMPSSVNTSGGIVGSLSQQFQESCLLFLW